MTWLRQLGVVVLGATAAVVMILLGWWQLEVFRAQGEAASAARAAEPARSLAQVAPVGSAIRDGYGRTVTVHGRYLEQQLLVRADTTAGDRVLTALRTDDGSVVPVVRGLVPPGDSAAAAPTGDVTQTGLLLPSEAAAGAAVPSVGRIDSVRIPALAQTWPGPLVDGYVLLSPADAAAQGLSPAPTVLPEARGRLRNGAYALQWWVFAAFALGMAGHIARDLGRRTGDVDETVISTR